MPSKQSPEQKETVGRVMHEFKHGELKTRGSGPKVKNPKQAIAIALHEAGATREEKPAKNRRTLRRTKAKEQRGETAEAATEGKRAQDRTMAAAGRRGRNGASEPSRKALYEEAKRRGVAGRSRMSKAELQRALSH